VDPKIAERWKQLEERIDMLVDSLSGLRQERARLTQE
jgi:hypothetical protein